MGNEPGVTESGLGEPGASSPAQSRNLRMPEHLIERARALADNQAGLGSWTPPALRHAATVVLVRTGEASLEVYLQRRVRTMAFAAGMYVFPGGAVEPEDIDQAMQWLASAQAPDLPLYARWAPDALGEDTLAARFAAIRETAEEAGVDLGDNAATELAYIAHWATPEVEDRRFDTRFYAAAIDDVQRASQTSTESDDHRWVTPRQALADYAAGEMLMLPPTVAVLTAFADEVRAAEVRAAQLRAADETDDGGIRAADVIAVLANKPVVPLMPHPVADEAAPAGIRWNLVDVRTSAEVSPSAFAPAGSESGGVHTSLVDRQGRPS